MFIELRLKKDGEAEYVMIQVKDITHFWPQKNHAVVSIGENVHHIEVDASYETLKAAIAQSGIPIILHQANKANEPYFKEHEARTTQRIVR